MEAGEEQKADGPVGATPEDAGGPPSGWTEEQSTAPPAPARSGASEAGGESPASPEEVGESLESLRSRARQADEYLEQWQRAAAELQNLHKRMVREKELIRRLVMRDLVRALLPSIDNLERALRVSCESSPQTLVEGVRLVQEEIHRVLTDFGVSPVEPGRERLDPNLHEAVASRFEPGMEDNTIVEVHERGYVLGDLLIRPARVTVASPPPEAAPSGPAPESTEPDNPSSE